MDQEGIIYIKSLTGPLHIYFKYKYIYIKSLGFFQFELWMLGSHLDFTDSSFTNLSCTMDDNFGEKCPANWIVMSW